MFPFRLFLFAGLFVAGCQMADQKPGSGIKDAGGKSDTGQLTTIQWIDSSNRDFGRIMEGQKLEVSFRFKNSGDKPLLIQHVQPSCGCTVPEQSSEPIAPGEESDIKATFTSEGHVGPNHKTLWVLANTKGSRTTALTFEVQVEKKKW
jgi:hypothetical protein